MGSRGQNGTIPLARIGALALPNSQGYIGTGGMMFRPAPAAVFTVRGPDIGVMAPPAADFLGPQFGPGQGGDSPGGGGCIAGMTSEVQSNWLVNGAVNPQAIPHRPGSFQWAAGPNRRGKA